MTGISYSRLPEAYWVLCFGNLMKRTVHKEMERQQDNERKQEDYDECNIYTTHQCVCHGIHNRGILVDHQISFWRIPVSYRYSDSDHIIVKISVIITSL